MKNFSEWLLQESAKTSLARTLSKFAVKTNKPVAILTASKGELFDNSKKIYPDQKRMELNN